MRAEEHISSQVERVLALRTFPGFVALAPSELAIVAEIAHERFFPAGTPIVLPGQPSTSVHFIRRGRVNVLKDGVPVRTFSSGGTIGGLAAMTRDPHGAHAVAVTDTDTFELPADDLEDVFEDSFPVLLTVLRGLNLGVLEARRDLLPGGGFSEAGDDWERVIGSMGLVERILALRRLFAFGKAKVEAIAELARDAVQMRADPGKVLWNEGDRSTHLYALLSGRIACESSSGHRFAFGPDSIVGGIDGLAGAPRWYTARADSDLILLQFAIEDLIDVIEDHPDMGVDMMRVAARLLVGLQRQIDQRTLSQHSSDQER